jgi:cell division protein FtsL
VSALPTTGRALSSRSAPRRSPARRPPRRVVGAPRHTRRYMALLVVVGAFGVFGVVALNALAAEQAFAARALEQEVAQLEVRYDELTAEVATLESPARVRQVAVDQLGMVPAERPAFVTLAGPAAARGGPAPPPATMAGFEAGVGAGVGAGLVADPVKAVLGVGR